MAQSEYSERLLSADSHIMEPRDLWETAHGCEMARQSSAYPRA